jgi:hypothetical protein
MLIRYKYQIIESGLFFLGVQLIPNFVKVVFGLAVVTLEVGTLKGLL